jgi:hypothetical protein
VGRNGEKLMPHEFVVGAFEPGDDDLGDFMLDIWLPFARDTCNWVDNRAPSVGTRPEIEVWTHRGSTGSPVSPYFFAHTKANSMQLFTGDDVDVAQEIYDQPNNPANAPIDTSFTVPTSGGIGPAMRTMLINSMPGPYEGYWLFSDTTGEYIHCVVKVSARQYRHFHVGRLKQVDGGPDLDPESFYVTSHFWSELSPDPIWYPINTTPNVTHSPYANAHQIPFRNNGGNSATGAFGAAMLNTAPCSRFYMPGLHPIRVATAVVNTAGSGHAVDDIITLALGTGGAGTPAQLRVTSVSAGAITAVSIEDPGDYDVEPEDGNTTIVVSQASTTGAGTGADFTLTFTGWKFYSANVQDGSLQASGSPAQKAGDGGVTTAVGDVMKRSRIGAAQTNYYDGNLGAILMSCDPNFTANANILVPIYVASAFDFQSDTRFGVVARVPDIFRVNMRDYSPEQTISVAGNDYKVFPVINDDSQNVLAGEGYSGWDGLAYRVETGAVV